MPTVTSFVLSALAVMRPAPPGAIAIRGEDGSLRVLEQADDAEPLSELLSAQQQQQQQDASRESSRLELAPLTPDAPPPAPAAPPSADWAGSSARSLCSPTFSRKRTLANSTRPPANGSVVETMARRRNVTGTANATIKASSIGGTTHLGNSSASLPALQVELWRKSELCDLELRSGNRVFYGHRLVLAAASPYIRSQVSSHTSDSTLRIETDVQPESLSALLAFLYTGECEVADELLCPLLQAASLFQVPALQAACASEIEQRLDASNAVDAWLLAESLTLPTLRHAAKQILFKQFETVAKDESFVRLTAPMMLALVSSHHLETTSEERVHSAIMAWASAQRPAATDATVISLLAHVRYPLCSAEFVRRARNSVPLSTPAGQTLLLNAFQSAWFSPAKRVKTRQEVCNDIELARGEFTWTIPHFSTVQQTKLHSPVFSSGNHTWRVLIFPRGNDVDQLSVYLDVADASTLPSGWWKLAHFSVTVHNLKDELSITKEDVHRFTEASSDWGSRGFVPLAHLQDPTSGFLSDDQLVITATVHVQSSSAEPL